MNNQKTHQNSIKELRKSKKLSVALQNNCKNSKINNNVILIDIKESVLHTKPKIFKTKVIFTLEMKEKQEKWKSTEYWLMRTSQNKMKK